MKEKMKDIKKAFKDMGRVINYLEELNEEHHLLAYKQDDLNNAIHNGLQVKK